MNDADSKLDVIVVNYKTASDLQEFGESYLTQDFPSTLVVVNVDPGPEDIEVAQTLVHEASLPCSRATYLQFDDNCGYAKAVNAGAAITSSQTLVAFNADVVLRPDSLSQCHERLWSDPRWGVLGPIQVDQQGRLTHSGIFGTENAPSFEGSWHQPPQDKHRVVREAISVSGSAYFVRRNVWSELTDCPIYQKTFPDAEGALAPFQHYYDEMYASLHARNHGYVVVYDGTVDPPLIHKWHRASPVGGDVDKNMPFIREQFRKACDDHGMEHE